MITQALFTGSWVYGKPNKNSDVDLVLLVTKKQLATLKKLADKDCSLVAPRNTISDGGGEISSASLRYGKLNLILTTDPVAFAVWHAGTADLVARKQRGTVLSKAAAIKIFRRLRQNHNVHRHQTGAVDQGGDNGD